MDRQEILARKNATIREHGPWSAHNIDLGGGIYTISDAATGQEAMVRRVLQITQDLAHQPLSKLRVLDLACLEGLYGIELALQGATVVGVEARQASLEKARVSKEILGLDKLELMQGDVRHISVDKYGQFDIVLCAGILYHLDAPDVFYFIENIFNLTTQFAIFDTHVSLAAQEERFHRNRKYFGWSYTEHASDSSMDQRAKALWASIDNVESFWLTKPSLLNFLSHTGFTSVYECHNPSTIHDFSDRVTMVAVKGTQRPLLSSAPVNSSREEDWPEISDRRFHPSQHASLYPPAGPMGGLLRPAKRLLKRLARI